MGEELSSSTSPTAQNIVALATGFRHAIRGARGTSESWAPDRLGALNHVVRDADGAWRPDGLTATRILLRRIVSAYETADADGRPRRDVQLTARAIRRRWGLFGYPSDEPTHNALLERGDLSASFHVDEVVDIDIDDGATLSYSDRSRWQQAVAKHPDALAVAAEGINLEWARIDDDEARLDSDNLPRWDTAKRTIPSWPPGGALPGTEGGWLIRALGAQLGHDERIVGPGESDGARNRQLLHVLRRLAVDRHAFYLGLRLDTQRHFFHLRHAMARVWFTDDLLDLGGIEEFGSDAEVGSTARPLLLSQASIARMEFYAVIHEWDARATDEVLRRRSSAREIFLGLERLPDALQQFEERLKETYFRTAKRGDEQLRDKPDDITIPEFVRRAEPKARELYTLAQQIRLLPTRDIVSEYISRRSDPDLLFDKMSTTSQRTVLLADQAVSLDCVNIRDQGLQATIAAFLRESSVAGIEYAQFDSRDRAVLGTKEGTRAGLMRAIAEGARGIEELSHVRRKANEEFSNVRVNERAALETEQQMSLALAGATVRVLEDLMKSDPRVQKSKSHDVVAGEVSAALLWSQRTVMALNSLDEKGYLASERYHDGYLASVAWRAPTSIIRHRALCTAYLVAAAYGIESDQLPTLLDLDIAYDRMVSTVEINDGHVPQVMQGVLLHSFLTAGRLPFAAQYATVLQSFDFVTMFAETEDTRAHYVYLDGRKRMLATLTNFERQWDYGAIGGVAAGSPIARALDKRSHHEFSHWRTYVELLGMFRTGSLDRDLLCLQCKWTGPVGKVRGSYCPRCDSTMIRVRTVST
ncbi:hypothetical protein ACSBPH_13495 [Microbacterium sp. F51-2R]|uniref:hypothetical protein n=1 Tax=Microbacterium sp. F51-2R TaxID=3445777 RepID=UPI003FA18D66